MATASRLLVGAIDFGKRTPDGHSLSNTTTSDPTVANVKNWHAGTGNLVTEKTPTVLLVKPDGKTMLAFGYEAENQYRYLVDKNQHKDYYFFRYFKMELMKELGKAGLSKERLTIALEPEAASLFSRHIPVGKNVDIERQSIAKLPTGSKYVVIDAGGGTIDITVHEVPSAHTLREVHAASGGDWGGRMVDHAFETFLKEFVGEEVFEDFKINEKEDRFDLLREFECRKREVGVNTGERVTMRFPVSLSDLFREKRNTRIIDFLKESVYAESIEIKRDKVKFASELFQSFFSESVRKTTGHLRRIVPADISTILMVGGYSESTLLQNAIREAFPDKQVVIPIGASSIVLRGALIFGHNPESVTERILKYTYGFQVWVPFKEEKHPKSKLIQTEDGDRCKDIFGKFVEINQHVKINKTQYRHVFLPKKLHKKGVLIDFYVSKEQNPIFVDDEGCSHIGKISFYFEETTEEVGRPVSVSIMFGGTEIFVDVEDQKTGKKLSKSIDFLG